MRRHTCYMVQLANGHWRVIVRTDWSIASAMKAGLPDPATVWPTFLEAWNAENQWCEWLRGYWLIP